MILLREKVKEQAVHVKIFKNRPSSIRALN
jgi:hypothetical protein